MIRKRDYRLLGRKVNIHASDRSGPNHDRSDDLIRQVLFPLASASLKTFQQSGFWEELPPRAEMPELMRIAYEHANYAFKKIIHGEFRNNLY